MSYKKIIGQNVEALKRAGADFYSLDKFYAYFVSNYGHELSEFDLEQPGLIIRELKQLCPNLR